MSRADVDEIRGTDALLRPVRDRAAAHPRRETLFGLLGPLARKTVGLSALTAAGQLSFVLALPILARLYSPSDFGLFTIYLSLVNICGPMVGLKFESALYAARTTRERRLTLALALMTMATLATAALVVLSLIARRLPGADGETACAVGWMAAAGILLAGTWSLSSAWAITREAIPVLGAARFVQPAAMTLLQIAAGMIAPSGVVLIGAHLASHVGYTTLIFARTLTRRDLVALHPRFWPALRRHAVAQRRFPAFILPAQVASLMVSNLPPVLLSALYGAAIAGHCGVAYRIVAAPLTIVSLPLGAVLIGRASRAGSFAAVRPLALRVLIAACLLVTIPLLAVGAAAPRLTGPLLGPGWALTGSIIAPFAVLAAMQALAAPFAEMTSIYRLQRLRALVEVGTAVLVVGAIGVGAAARWGPLPTIWLLSLAGAAGVLGGLTLIWARLSRAGDEARA